MGGAILQDDIYMGWYLLRCLLVHVVMSGDGANA